MQQPWVASMPPGPGRLAIAATQNIRFDPPSPEPTLGCGMIKWCYSAAALARLPSLNGTAEVVVFTNDAERVLAECLPRPRVIGFSAELRADAARWEESRRASLRDRGNLGPFAFGMATLMKWEAFRRTEYEAVLLLDDDVDLFLHSAGVPPPLGSRARAELDYTWSVLYPQFLASQATPLLPTSAHTVAHAHARAA